MLMFGIISESSIVFQSDLHVIMKSKHTKNKFYQKEIKGELKNDKIY